MAALVQQEGREKEVLDAVYELLLDYLMPGSANTNNKCIFSPEMIIPHILRAASFGHYTESCLRLVAAAYLLAEAGIHLSSLI